jgi:glycopeptide antibiotics resistance protein
VAEYEKFGEVGAGEAEIMKFRILLILYLLALLVMVTVPLGTTILSDTFVFELRLDYLMHVLAFAPLVVLWRLGFPGHSLWKIMGVGVVLAVGLEGVQYLLPYRSWNVNDAVGNMIGVGVGYWVLGIRGWMLGFAD